MEIPITFYCNDRLIERGINPAVTLLDFLRNHLNLTGTKEGCREGDCGACTVLIGSLAYGKVKYRAVNSCLIPVGDLNGRHIVSIEGINQDALTPVQEYMVQDGGSQCGFCTPGFVMSMTGYFLNHDSYSVEDGIEALDGNICRCTGYAGIKRALKDAIDRVESLSSSKQTHLVNLINANIVPAYFNDMPEKLKKLTIKKSRIKTDNAQPVAVGGGTDLFVQRWEGLLNEPIHFVGAQKKEGKVSEEDGRILIDSDVTVSQILNSDIINKYFPSLKNDLKLFGSLPIRNRATIAGNIVNASPIADMVNILLALDANVHLSSGERKRILPLKKFYLGYKQLDKTVDELIEAVSVPIPRQPYLFNYEKISRRQYLDIASVNSSILLRMENSHIKQAHLSAGGVAPIPTYLRGCADHLAGKTITANVVKEAAVIAQSEVSPISDARGSAEYKRFLLGQLIKAHFIKLFPEIILPEEVL
jgi:xanthine dehydrogenase small subunit